MLAWAAGSGYGLAQVRGALGACAFLMRILAVGGHCMGSEPTVSAPPRIAAAVVEASLRVGGAAADASASGGDTSSHPRRTWRVDGFMLGMVTAMALAAVFPAPGAHGGWMHPELLTKLGVALIFFLHGVLLSLPAMKAGALNWRLHIVVQGSTFLLFPLMGWLGLRLAGGLIPADMQLGFFFLCALPSTVSSSVAMTAAARGNVAAAVFNATLSSLLGILLTPLWMTLIPHAAASIPLGPVVLDLMTWLLLPLLLGQLVRPWLGAWALRHKKRVSTLDRAIILLLVYTSFCDSMQLGVWKQEGIAVILAVVMGALLMFALVLGFTTGLCRLLRFNAADRAAAVFCGSKKSLAQGVPIAQLMFAGNPALGLILLPIMVYHPLQLFLCGMLASRWARYGAPPSDL